MSERKILLSGNDKILKKRRLRTENIEPENQTDEDEELNIALQASRRRIREPSLQNINDEPGPSGALHFLIADEPENPNILNRNLNFEKQSNNNSKTNATCVFLFKNRNYGELSD